MPEFKQANMQDNPKDKEGKTKRDREHEKGVKAHGSIDLPANAPENQGKDLDRDPALYGGGASPGIIPTEPAKPEPAKPEPKSFGSGRGHE